MSSPSRDYVREADFVLEDAARRLESLVSELAGQFTPFPFFPGTLTQIVEVEPKPVRPAEAGFIGLGADAGFYEYEVSLDPDPFVANRRDTLKPVQLDAAQYIQFARAAIEELTRLLPHASPHR